MQIATPIASVLLTMLLGAVIFVLDYGCLFWAEQRVPSGIAAVVLACIPVFMTLLEIIILRTQQLTFRLGVALLIGILGVAVIQAVLAGVGFLVAGLPGAVGKTAASAGRSTPGTAPSTIFAVAMAAPVLPAVTNPAA